MYNVPTYLYFCTLARQLSVTCDNYGTCCSLNLLDIMTTLKKRCDRNLSERRNLLSKYDELPKMSQRDAAVQLKISQSTLNDLLKSRAKIVAGQEPETRKRKREGKSKTVDEALLVWFKQGTAMKAPINRSILMEKATSLGKEMGEDFQATDGWLTRWKGRHGIEYKKLHGEKADADEIGASAWIKNVWPTIIEKYDASNIYNLDETGLYYRATPDYCMVFKKNPASAGKKLKERITVALTCNMTGSDKRKPLVIGKSKNPRCFKGVKNLPVDYRNNMNAWMTASLFEDYLRQWDSKLDRKIALLLDNCTAHPPQLILKNIDLIFLPANTTSIIQPLDQGIIKTFKTLLRSDMRRRIIDAIDGGEGSASEIAKKITVLDAIHMTHRAWGLVSAKCIINCFRKSGMISRIDADPSFNSPSEEVINPVDMNKNDFLEWVDIDSQLPTSHTMDDSEIAASVLESARKCDDSNDDDEDDEDREERNPITRRQVLEAVNVLRRAVEENDVGTEHFTSLNDLQSLLTMALPLKQTKLTQFLK